MHPVLRNILAVIIGAVVGMIVNSGLIALGHFIMPMKGVDPNDMKALGEAMHNLGPEYFIFPFLAHAVGTLVGAFIAAKLAANRKMIFAISIGVFFLLGGIAATVMITPPLWMIIVDLALAYIPMGWIGGKLAMGKGKP